MNKSKKTTSAEGVSLDDLDRALIEELKKNSRQSWRELARKLNVSPVTVINRIKALEKKGVIRGYTVKLDYRKMGLELMGFTKISVPGKYYDKIVEELVRKPEIRDLYAISGEFDLIAFYRTRTMPELMRIVQNIYRMEEVKTHSFIAVALKEDYEKISEVMYNTDLK